MKILGMEVVPMETMPQGSLVLLSPQFDERGMLDMEGTAKASVQVANISENLSDPYLTQDLLERL